MPGQFDSINRANSNGIAVFIHHLLLNMSSIWYGFIRHSLNSSFDHNLMHLPSSVTNLKIMA